MNVPYAYAALTLAMSTPKEPLPASEVAAAITAHALRLNDRFTIEVVEAFTTCPFARAARLAGRARRDVLLQSETDAEPVLQAIDRFECGDSDVEIVQLIFPRIGASAREFDEFVSRVRATRAAQPRDAVFALASFHPDYGYDGATADSMTPFFRRTPDPTIQLVRLAVLDALAREPGPRTPTPDQVDGFLRGIAPPPVSLSAWIARENFARVQRDGAGAIAAIYASISADRARSYEAANAVRETYE